MAHLRLIATAFLLAAVPVARAALAPQPTTLTCDHMDMWSEADETKAICTGHVSVTGTDLSILCDKLELTATRLGGKAAAALPTLEKFRYLLATGHVSITQGTRRATCGRAEVLPREEKVVLTEEPVVIDTANGFVSAGEKITMLRGQERVEVDKPRLTGPPIRDLGFDRTKDAPADQSSSPNISVPPPPK
ncbi:MAG TPA: LptA/OstA family protein [Opitutus sp.]|nr:LptA/OstA family protein [Opitutus sp.]